MTTFEAAAQYYNKQHADDDLDSYDPLKREQHLREQYRMAEKKFDALCKEMHVPFLDIKLYRKYFIQSKTENNLQCLLSICECIEAHKQQTLRLLKLIFEREQVVHHIKVMAFDYAQGKLSTLEAQTKVLQLLYALQQASLHIIEGIVEWRKRLTRDYAFEWRGINYMFKIIKDCQFIDTCDLKAVLPFLQLSSHPLCANLHSLNLFGPQQIGNANTGASAIAITYPMKPTTKKSLVPQVSPEFQERLKAGEIMIFAEYHKQVNLLKELTAKHSGGTFLTVLSVTHIIPNCGDGIRLNNKAWDKRLQRALTFAFKKLQTKMEEAQAIGQQQQQHANIQKEAETVPPPPSATPQLDDSTHVGDTTATSSVVEGGAEGGQDDTTTTSAADNTHNESTDQLDKSGTNTHTTHNDDTSKASGDTKDESELKGGGGVNTTTSSSGSEGTTKDSHSVSQKSALSSSTTSAGQ